VRACERLGGAQRENSILPANWRIHPGEPSLCTPRVSKIGSAPNPGFDTLQPDSAPDYLIPCTFLGFGCDRGVNPVMAQRLAAAKSSIRSTFDVKGVKTRIRA
jgi:hypothetical protein